MILICFIMVLCLNVVLCRFVLLPLWLLPWEIPLRFIEKHRDKDWIRRFFAPTVLWLNFIFAFLLSAILCGLILAGIYRQFSEHLTYRWIYWLIGCGSVGLVGTVPCINDMLNIEYVKEIMLKNIIWRLVGIVVFSLAIWLLPETQTN